MWEDVSLPKEEKNKSIPRFPLIYENALMGDHDSRDPRLQLNVKSLGVHHINAARYNTMAYSVSRHRSTKQELEF